jgi:hypothetical protein
LFVAIAQKWMLCVTIDVRRVGVVDKEGSAVSESISSNPRAALE